MGKLKVGSKQWKEQLLEALITHAQPMVICPACNRVGLEGYICFYCNHDGGGEPVDPLEWL